MLSNYRTTNNFREIARIIAQPENLKDSILWQNTGGKRYIFEIENIEVNPRFMSFVTKLSRRMFPLFNSLAPTYCKLSYRDTVFKVSIVNLMDNNVTFNIPGDVKTLELRENPRQKFRPSEGKYITVQVESDILPSATQALKFQVIDVSNQGVSLVISEKNIHFFEANYEFMVTTLMEHELQDKIKMELVYSQLFKFKQRGRITSAYRVGFKFAEPLTVNFR